MKLKFLTIVALGALLMTSCGGDTKKEDNTSKTPAKQEVKKETPKPAETATKIDLDAPTLDKQGIGRFKDVKIAEKIDDAMAEKGHQIFKTNCTACHKFKKRYVGPALKGVTKIRSAAWIMNMVTNAKEMLEKDPIAKALITEYHAPMAQQNLTDEQVRALYEYLRTK